MANRHFAEIGDIWKHLPLAEILAIEQPRRYWESHAGSAQYALTPSMGRDYGVYTFDDRARHSPVLRHSVFWRLLDGLRGCDDRLALYPGSPFIAMSVSEAAQFLFCDLDGDSLIDIRRSAEELGQARDAVQCAQADGVATLWSTASQLPDGPARRTLAHIDPYRPWEPNSDGRTSLDLFGHLGRRGFQTVLWYGYDSAEGRAVCWDHIRATLETYQPDAASLWCGEINLLGIHDPTFSVNPGVLGCGILTSGLGDAAIRACVRLGQALESIYQAAVLPGDQSGALAFSVRRLG